MSCPFKEIFGKVDEGVHKAKIFGIAIVDLALTLALAFLLSYWLKINFWLTFLILMIVAVITHYIFCVPTALNKKLGLVKT